VLAEKKMKKSSALRHHCRERANPEPPLYLPLSKDEDEDGVDVGSRFSLGLISRRLKLKSPAWPE
jgi:hypothetical protein